MKSTWICWLVAASLVAASTAGAAERGTRRSAAELINVFLGPGYAQWLVGPIAWMASEEEIDAFLAIADEASAERFIEEFWAGRKPIGNAAGITARQQFEHLAEEADRLYGEETLPGRRTDRGTVYIIFGPPDEVDYQSVQPATQGRYRARPMSSRYGQMERWHYRRGRGSLSGRSPKRMYRFVRKGDLTRFVDPARQQ